MLSLTTAIKSLPERISKLLGGIALSISGILNGTKSRLVVMKAMIILNSLKIIDIPISY